MYIFKNALKNLVRNKERNILLGIIMTAILSCTAISILINTTSNEIIKDYKNRFGAEVFIQSNMEKTQEKINAGKMDELNKGVPNDIKEKISKSEYVKETIFSLTFSGYSKEIKALDQPDGSDDIDMSNVVAIGGQSNLTKRPNLNILGGLNEEGNKEFKNGTRKIIKGEMPKKNNEAIVSEEFAKLNNLKVGDKMKIQNPQDPEKYESLELSISGIYYDGAKSDNNFGVKHHMLNRSNEIITTYDTLKLYDSKSDEDFVHIDAKYYLKDPDLVDNFNKEAHKLGLSDLFDLSVDSSSYNSIVKPVEGLKEISKIFMTLVLGFGGSVLVLISILAIRERKYEIGVLRAMGMKKGKVALGLVFETLSMIVISLSLGLTIGSISAQPISDMLLQGQIEAQKQAGSMSMTIGMGGPSQSVPALEKLNVFLSSEAILSITLIALLLGAVSAGIGILYINRYEPRKILTERD
ncbi:MAG TPA: ABC transporter permease [Terrisporobacter glycolicus]|uniref:ABC transporter permease n=1 Tax=Terrisporobacter TaxID=1505652 RepID=UPI000E93D5E9|nr:MULTISPECIES: FtsX-like permease family protein [Terrisporobacter]MBN9648094.1 FtsX-like permease family protein [Terrisporobacter glycolicus]HBI94368.1 ABC transporter permease [Terrisporobacter hibernicus]